MSVSRFIKVYLPSPLYHAIEQRAFEHSCPLSEYIRNLILTDLQPDTAPPALSLSPPAELCSHGQPASECARCIIEEDLYGHRGEPPISLSLCPGHKGSV